VAKSVVMQFKDETHSWKTHMRRTFSSYANFSHGEVEIKDQNTNNTFRVNDYKLKIFQERRHIQIKEQTKLNLTDPKSRNRVHHRKIIEISLTLNTLLSSHSFLFTLCHIEDNI